MEVAVGIRISAVLQCLFLAIIAKSMDLDRRNSKDEKLLEWTANFGRESNGGSMNGESTTTSANDIHGKFKPVLTHSNDRERNEVNPEVNDTVASIMAHPPMKTAPASSDIPSDFIPGNKFCYGQLPESRICDPQDIIGRDEGMH